MKEEWNEQVNHPLQSWEWGEFRGKRQPVTRVEGMLVMWSKIPMTPWYFGYIPMGAVPSQKQIEELKQSAKQNHAVGIRLEPNARRTELSNFQFKIFNQFLKPGRKLFKSKTILLDLTKSEEELLKNMHPKGRYNIKIAQKHGVEILEDNSDEAFVKYLDLMFGGTAKRQGIYMHSRVYHAQMWKALKNNLARLFIASYQNKIIAADIIFSFKDKIYYAYGASALEHKEVMPQTRLLWEIMRWGKANNYKFFDLWGAEEWKGFSRFKEQFGGETVELAGSYDLPVNKLIYPVFRLAEDVRWKILRILK